MTVQSGVRSKLKPLGNRVLVKATKRKETKCGGIVLPESAQPKQEIGTVLSVGKGKKNNDGSLTEMCVKEGQIVIWDKYGGSEINLDGEEFVMVKEDDIIAIVE